LQTIIMEQYSEEMGQNKLRQNTISYPEVFITQFRSSRQQRQKYHLPPSCNESSWGSTTQRIRQKCGIRRKRSAHVDCIVFCFVVVCFVQWKRCEGLQR
jgi:hypothetical protein